MTWRTYMQWIHSHYPKLCLNQGQEKMGNYGENFLWTFTSWFQIIYKLAIEKFRPRAQDTSTPLQEEHGTNIGTHPTLSSIRCRVRIHWRFDLFNFTYDSLDAHETKIKKYLWQISSFFNNNESHKYILSLSHHLLFLHKTPKIMKGRIKQVQNSTPIK